MFACRKDDVYDVVLDFVVDVDFVHDFARLHDSFGRDHRVYRLYHARFRHQVEDYALLFFVGIADFKLEHESVDLRFGELVCSLLVDWVLRCEHEERLGKRVCLAADCYLAFLHGFEQRALDFCGGAVDFVGKHDVCENRAFLRDKFALLLVVD